MLTKTSGESVADQGRIGGIGDEYPFFTRFHPKKRSGFCKFDLIRFFFKFCVGSVAPAFHVFQRMFQADAAIRLQHCDGSGFLNIFIGVDQV